ncbi:MAG: FAD-dependent oxidoreductase, partial [Thermoanaerobaculia bacterium]|nr:FAD-dependent oxidoreductase [Thermoanaerobaculia bacterium]
PRACRETDLPPIKDYGLRIADYGLSGVFDSIRNPQSVIRPEVSGQSAIAVIGAGPAGLSCATELAALGFETHLFEASGAIGGQFNMAKKIPGKEEFAETLRYFSGLLEKTGVQVHLNTRASAEMLKAAGFREVVLATGITPRTPALEGIDHPRA